MDTCAFIGGFTCLNDISDGSHANEFRTKSFVHSSPFGPVLGSSDQIPDHPRIRLWRYGDLQVDVTDDEFITTSQELTASYSTYVTLEAGDVIWIGNPSESKTRTEWR